MFIATLMEAIAESVISVMRMKEKRKLSPHMRNAIATIGFIILLLISICIALYAK